MYCPDRENDAEKLLNYLLKFAAVFGILKFTVLCGGEKVANQHISAEEMQRQTAFSEKLRAVNDCGREKKALVVTYGCQQNENDSERIRGMLSAAGYGFCDAPEDADVIIYNTCAVRENAELRVFGNLGALKLIKRKKPDLIIGICGCMMQQKHIAEQIKRKYKHVDILFGTHTLYTLPELLWNVVETKQRSIHIIDSDGAIAEKIPIVRAPGVTAYISIMYGCNNFCSYCIVPYVRGRERSRNPEEILNEVRDVAAKGYKEIMLLGQNVNSYGKDLTESIDFADLLGLVSQVDGIERIRFMTSHPKDFSDKLIDVIAENKKVCKQMHLPVQAGSNAVLDTMNRRYTRESYLEKIKKLRARVPDVTLTTDIIVGFPTETQADFEQTLSLIREVRYDSLYSFIYSKRVGTPAAEMEFVLDEAQIHQNFDRLLEAQNEISREINESYVGETYDVLLEGTSKTDETTLTGRTEGGKLVHITGDTSLIGTMVRVKIVSAMTWYLKGELLK